MKLSYSTPRTIYMVRTAASSRNTSFESEDWKACAAPWKLIPKLAGSSISLSAELIASTAPPREAPGARLNEIVVTGNCLRCEICSGDCLTSSRLTALSGTWPDVEADEGRYIEFSELSDLFIAGSMSMITRY